MSKRLAVLAASTMLASLSAPVAAQVGPADQHYADVAESAMSGGRAIEGWADEAQVGADYVEAVTEDPAYDYEQREIVQSYGDADEGGEWNDEQADDRGEGRGRHHRGGHHGGQRGGHHAMQSQAPRLAYGQAERAEWLAQCRALHARRDEPVYYYEDEHDADEGLIGGVLGAVVGGVIGNRVNDGDRLLGTVIGAGAGGLAGAVLGSVIDGLGDDEDERPAYYTDEEPRFDYCEAYLLNYERGYGTPAQMAYAPVMMVPVAQQPIQHQVEHRRRYQVIEEEVEVEAPAHQRHVRHAAPRRERGKLERLD